MTYVYTDDSDFCFNLRKMCIIVKHLHENDVDDDLMFMIMILLQKRLIVRFYLCHPILKPTNLYHPKYNQIMEKMDGIWLMYNHVVLTELKFRPKPFHCSPLFQGHDTKYLLYAQKCEKIYAAFK
jgi:hypothetical protein